MKKTFWVLAVLAAGVLGTLFFKGYFDKNMPLGTGDYNFYYSSATQATSTVNITSWTTVLSADSGRGYTALCDNANGGINTANPIYLAFGATSTKPYGFRLGSGECYELTLDKMFYGNVYAIASTSTTTLLRVTGSY